MAEVELIGVPFDGYGRTGNQALARQLCETSASWRHSVVMSWWPWTTSTCRRRALGAVATQARSTRPR